MEYAKDEVFSIHYNKRKDRLEYSLFRRFFYKIINNKFLSLLIIVGICFSIVNFTLIFWFFEILNKM